MKKEQLLVKHTLLMVKYKPMHYTFTFPDLMKNFLACYTFTYRLVT